MRSFGRLTVLKAVSVRMSSYSKECLIIILCYSIYGTNVYWGKGYFPSFFEVFVTHSSPCCKTQYVMEALCEYGYTIVIQMVYAVGPACFWIHASHAFFFREEVYLPSPYIKLRCIAY